MDFSRDANHQAKLKIIIAMLIWGSLGVFAVLLSWPPPLVAAVRAIIGAVFGLVLFLSTKGSFAWQEMRRHIGHLFIAGLCVGINWILLFYGFKYTTIPVATLCYYMAPVYVILASPFFFGERLTALKLGAGAVAFFGTGLVSGLIENLAHGDFGDMRGAFFAIVSGLLYATVMLLNKKVTTLAAPTKTLVQMIVAALAITPFALFTTDFGELAINTRSLFLILTLGLVHTGLAFHLFFSAVEKIPAQTTALLSYLDPVSAIILAAIFLGQPVSIVQIIGGCLIIGAALVS